MPRLRLRHPDVPPSLGGWITVNEEHQPRFWATVWADVLLSGTAPGTRGSHLVAIEKLYRSATEQLGADALDRILGDLDFDALEAVLGGFLTTLRNDSATAGVDRDGTWQTALRFISDVTAHIGRAPGQQMQELSTRLERLRRLYRQLSPTPPREPPPIRALPAIVVEELYEITNPESRRNPFRTPSLRWRNFLIFLLFLHLGLRRGECLLLRADAIKEGFDPATGEIRNWINIDETDDEDDDPRYLAPSLKTVQSKRQLPVSQEIVRVTDHYVANYRGSAQHGFLMNSQKNGPLAAQSLQDIFETLTDCLSDRAIKALKTRGKENVTAHDCRHTSAVYRLARYVEHGADLDHAIEKLRVFFGWSSESQMPRHYARAYFETSLGEVWDETFDTFVETLRKRTGERK